MADMHNDGGPVVGRRLAAAAALISALALVAVLPLFLWEHRVPLIVSALGVFSLAWGVLRGAVSRGLRKVIWLGLAAGGAVAIVAAFFWTGQNAGLMLLAVGGVVVIFALAARYALEMPAPREPLVTVTGTMTNPVLLLNPKSGGGKVEKFGLEAAASELGVKTSVLRGGDDLEALALEAVGCGADALGMAGGDGSQALVARIAAKHDVPFVCVPAGTRNHFALDLGLDREDPRKALAAFRGHERRVDYAEVNGRLFVNNVSLGLYARIVQEPGYREAKAKTASELLPTLLGESAPPFDLSFTDPEGRRYDGAQLILVSNNPYEFTEGGDVVGRTRLDSGLLGVAVVAVYDPPSVRRFVEAVHRIRMGSFDGLRQWSCSSFRVESGDSGIPAGVDGEALELEPPLEFAIVPGGLRVLVPAGTRSPAPRRSTFDPATLRRLWAVATRGVDSASASHASRVESG